MLHVCVPVVLHFQKKITIHLWLNLYFLMHIYILALYLVQKKLIVGCGFDINLKQYIIYIHIIIQSILSEYIILKHTRWREINEFLTFTLFRYIAIIPVDGKDMAITRSENSKKELIIITI